MFHAACRICISEYKKEIEKLLSKKVRFREIARRYQNVFGIRLRKLEQSIGNHRKKHFKELTKEEQDLIEGYEKGEVSVERIQRFIAARTLENMLMNPNRLKFNDVIRLENLLMRKEKVKQNRLGQWRW